MRIPKFPLRRAHSGTKQDVDRSGAAVNGSCGGESYDIQMPPQPEVYRGFENRAARAGAIALAMHHPDTAAPGIAAMCDELRQPIARFRLSQSVKIEIILAGNQAAAQAAQHLIANSAALKRKRRDGVFAGGGADQRHDPIEIFSSATLWCANARAARSRRRDMAWWASCQRFDVAHGRAKRVGVGRIVFGVAVGYALFSHGSSIVREAPAGAAQTVK